MLTKEERSAVVSASFRGMTHEQVRPDFVRRFRKSGPQQDGYKDPTQ